MKTRTFGRSGMKDGVERAAPKCRGGGDVRGALRFCPLSEKQVPEIDRIIIPNNE